MLIEFLEPGGLLLDCGSPSLRLMHPNVLPQPEHPPQRFLIVRYPSAKPFPVATLQRFQILLCAQRGFTEQPGNLWRYVCDQLCLFDGGCGVEVLADVVVDLEVGPFMGRDVEAVGLTNAVQSELAKVVVAFDTADQVADGLAETRPAGWMSSVFTSALLRLR